MAHCPTCRCDDPDGPWILYVNPRANSGAGGVVPPASYTMVLEG